MSVDQLPAYVEERIQKWDKLFAAAAAEPAIAPVPIKIKLSNGQFVDSVAGTKPFELQKKLLADTASYPGLIVPKTLVVCKVDGAYWDSHRPLVADCALDFFDFDSAEGKYCFWHSSAHIMGQAIELLFPQAKLCIGPPIEEGGFYYDADLGKDAKGAAITFSPDDRDGIQRCVNKAIKEKQPFQRLVLTKAQALDLFAGNEYKAQIIARIPEGEATTAYRCGPLIDLCRGPHVPNTGFVQAMVLRHNSSAFWLGKQENPVLQRLYGVSFPSAAQLKDYETMIREAEARDHRRIGIAQDLFFFHPLSPGSCFFQPRGARLYNTLQAYIRDQYRKRGYDEVISPNVYNVDLWKQSGHYQNYRENMFSFDCEGQEFAMKPMNCPGHCLMFDARARSYRDLPMRMADFGVLHRNELSGALTGLTRVRRFQQDDAHIFCRKDQISAEVAGVLDMLQEVYGHFGFSFSLCLSTRPENFLGDIALWDDAEAALKDCLNTFCGAHGHEWRLNPGDGAFYGPKIDIQLTDALKRKHQCGTCQLDFQLPIRFGLSYRTSATVEAEEAAAAAAEAESAAAAAAPEPVLTKEQKEAAKAAFKEAAKAEKAARAAAAKAAHAAAQAAKAAAGPTEAEAAAAAAAAAPAAKKAEADALPETGVTEVVSAPVVAADGAAAAAAGGCGGCCAAPKEYEWVEKPLPTGHERPVMVHRAILGSVERMIAVLIEHTAGKWPLWLNPRQLIVVPVADKFYDYARKVQQHMHALGFYVDVDETNHQFNKKVREAVVSGYNFCLVVGQKEAEDGTVNVRFRDVANKQELMTLEAAGQYFLDLKNNHK